MNKVTILHNPRCSKSRETLKLLEDRGAKIEIIDYLNGGLTFDQLKEIVRLLKVPVKEIIRTKEEEYQLVAINLDEEDEVIKAILKYPKLLERPIVIKGNKAVIGRPPENVLTLF